MKQQRQTHVDLLVLLGSVGLTELMLLLAMTLRKALPLGRILEPGADYIPPALFGLVGVIWLFFLVIFAAPRLFRTGALIDGLWQIVTAVALAALTFAGIMYLSFRDVSRLYFIYFVVLDLLALLAFFVVMRLLIRRQAQQPSAQRRVLIAGTGASAAGLVRALSRQWSGRSPVVGMLASDPRIVGTEIEGAPVVGTLDGALDQINTSAIDEIVIALSLDEHPDAVRLVRQLQSTPVHIRLVPDFLDFAVMSASVEYLEGLPVVGLRVPAISEEQRVAKRLFDILVSGMLLLLLSPLLLVAALIIRRTSTGPALYRSDRIGEHGTTFKMYKFRTMVKDADLLFNTVSLRRPDGKLEFKQPGDPRVTRIGRWLRRTSLDELPQLLNVLKGDMSLVGPRPELPIIVREEYEPWQWSRFTVPQGMTGWWQINRRGFAHQHLCTADDLYYIQNYSLMLDIKILLRTIFVVLRGEGAY
ncbi:MAG: sugar transferase [Roseiflexaceae bacterium]|nr:sugar transferase [Roseiflexaceae bacterium]